MMYKLWVEGTGGLPELVPGLVFSEQGAEEYCRKHRLTPCYMMPEEDYRNYRNELGRVRTERAIQQVPMVYDERLAEYDSPKTPRWTPNNINDVDWMPIDRRGIAKVPMAKPKWFKMSGRRGKK